MANDDQTNSNQLSQTDDLDESRELTTQEINDFVTTHPDAKKILSSILPGLDVNELVGHEFLRCQFMAIYNLSRSDLADSTIRVARFPDVKVVGAVDINLIPIDHQPIEISIGLRIAQIHRRIDRVGQIGHRPPSRDSSRSDFLKVFQVNGSWEGDTVGQNWAERVCALRHFGSVANAITVGIGISRVGSQLQFLGIG